MGAPLFPDCAFPENCECDKRGYGYEATQCVVPTVAAAAAAFGMPAASIARLLKSQTETRTTGTLTFRISFDHPASSYGQPVLLDADGKTYGSADLLMTRDLWNQMVADIKERGATEVTLDWTIVPAKGGE